MTALLKTVNIKKLSFIKKKKYKMLLNNHRKIKIRAAGVKPKTYLCLKVSYNAKNPKFKVSGYVGMLNYKKIILKV